MCCGRREDGLHGICPYKKGAQRLQHESFLLIRPNIVDPDIVGWSHFGWGHHYLSRLQRFGGVVIIDVMISPVDRHLDEVRTVWRTVDPEVPLEVPLSSRAIPSPWPLISRLYHGIDAWMQRPCRAIYIRSSAEVKLHDTEAAVS